MIHRLKNIFQVVCTFLAAYMTLILAGRYLENRDATAITYKRYNLSPQDKYPTFSVCFEGPEFHFYHDIPLFDAYSLTANQYKQLLSGATALKHEYNRTSRLYKKVPVSMTNDSDERISDFHLQMSNILVQLNFSTEHSKNDVSYLKHETPEEKLPFFIGYQSPDKICYTRESNDAVDSIRMNDMLVFDGKILNRKMYENTEIQIFVHYPGQLFRSLDNPGFTSSFLEYQNEKLLEIKLSQGTVLKKRPDSNSPCNTDIKDHDKYLESELTKRIKCIPPYWKQGIQTERGWDECTSKDSLRKAYEYIKNYNLLLASLDSPCVEMVNSVSYNWQGEQQKDKIAIKFVYKDKYYQEIEYVEDFGFESFWSGIGGFVGIFLGYSMMQFPEFLGTII